MTRVAIAIVISGCYDGCQPSGSQPPIALDAPAPPPSPPPPGPPPPGPPPTAVYVVPAEVFIDGGNPAWFSLRVLVDRDGALREPADGEVQWSLPAPPASTTVDNGSVKVGAPFTTDFNVVATVGGVSASSTIKAFNAPGVGDVVLSADHPAQFPSVAIASGWLPGGVCAGAAGLDDPVAFVRKGPLPSLQPIPSGSSPADCRVDGAVFSPIVASWRDVMSWQPGTDFMHAASLGSSAIADPQPFTVTARVVIGVTDSYCPDPSSEYCVPFPAVLLGAQDWIYRATALANNVYWMNRGGVSFIIPPAIPSDIVLLPTVHDCSTVPTSGPQAPNAGELTIYVVDQLVAVARGLTCYEIGTSPGVESNKKVILIGYHDAFTKATLAHELGHALGHRTPAHVNEGITGFGDYNVMSEVYVSGIDRFYLTLGQIYKMSVDARSWLNEAGIRTGPTETCQCALDVSKPCPRLARDVKPLEKPVTMVPGTCS